MVELCSGSESGSGSQLLPNTGVAMIISNIFDCWHKVRGTVLSKISLYENIDFG